MFSRIAPAGAALMAALSAAAAPAPAKTAPAPATPAKTAAPLAVDFESPATTGWTTDSDSRIGVTDERYKSGGHSLRWSWRTTRTALVFRDPAGLPTQAAGAGFGIWVYNERPVAATMRVELLQGDKVVGACRFSLNYAGWRPLGAAYREMAGGATPANGLRFLPPQGVPFGRLHLDHARVNLTGMDRHHHGYALADTPTEAAEPPAGADTLTRTRPWLPARQTTVTEAERASLATLEARILPPTRRPATGLKPGTLDRLRARLGELRIRRTGDRITGAPVDGGSFLRPDDAVDLWAYLACCGEVRDAYFLAKTPEETAELRRMFVDLCAHFLDQGWAGDTRLRGFANYPGKVEPSWFLSMRDVLNEAGLARGMALALASTVACQGEGDYLAENPHASMDGLGFWSDRLVAYLMLLPDESERLQHLRVAQRFLSLALTNRHTLGPDGCSYHHGAFHFAYASYNLPRQMRQLQQLAGTEFRLGREAHERLKTYAHAIAFTLSAGEQPYNLGARPGTPLHGSMGLFAVELAKLGTPDGASDYDPDMAGLALTVFSELGEPGRAALEREPLKGWIARGATPTPLSGHLTLNGSPLAVHRRPGWLVGIAGMGPFFRGLEIYGWTQQNNYARYARNGSVCVVSGGTPPSLADSGWNYDGWNWCHFPGTTALLRREREIFEGYSMSGNGLPLAGGTRLGPDGLWAMDFAGADGVKFKRSVFCVDNRITVVTSGIRVDSKLTAPAVTTLFQNSLRPGHDRVWVLGEKSLGEPARVELDGDRPYRLMDNEGTAYYVHPGHDPLEIVCREQSWHYLISRYAVDPKKPRLDFKDYRYWSPRGKNFDELESHYRPSTGKFALGFFRHGPNPADAGCAYTMLIRADRSRLGELKTTPPATLRRRDSRAHIVADDATGATGYALFAPNDALDDPGPLLANTRPCVVMLRAAGPALRLSVADPDIARKDDVRLTLRGRHRVADAPAGRVTAVVEGDVTRLELKPDYYLPLEFTLEPAP